MLGNIGLKDHQVHGLVLLCFDVVKKKIVEICIHLNKGGLRKLQRGITKCKCC
jgi:hypothetical protein